MDPSTINLIVSLISGILGGNIAGAGLSEKSLGALGNSITGLFGGAIGGYILKALGIVAAVATAATTTPEAGHAASHFDLGSFLANVGGSGVGGAILTAIVAYIKCASSHKAE